MLKPVVIVGGGLAGLTLGIGLRQQNVPVTIFEAGAYPRHRVCGEFINGRGIASLESLGLLEHLRRAGAVEGTSAAFFSGKLSIPSRSLPTPALCVSRYVLDSCLAREFQRLGGNLQSGTRWAGQYTEGVIRASGRRPEKSTDGWRLFGLKAHVRGVELSADLEMHFLPSGYVGLCRLPHGEVNVCGLFRSRTAVRDLSDHWKEWLSGPVDSTLNSRLKNGEFDVSSFCSIAGISLRPVRAELLGECCIGDALTMIPPITGNGMSMAFESAELAIAPLVSYSRGESLWETASRQIATQCDQKFARRLRSSAWIQRVLFQRSARQLAFACASLSEKIWRGLFRQTR